MAAERALLDASVLVGFLHSDDQDHEASVDAIRDFRGTLLTTEAVLTESMHLLGRTVGGPAACLTFFLRGGAMRVPSSRSSLARCRSLLDEYRDLLPADFGDASLVALAEETDTWTVLTLDRRDFRVPGRGRQGVRRPPLLRVALLRASPTAKREDLKVRASRSTPGGGIGGDRGSRACSMVISYFSV